MTPGLRRLPVGAEPSPGRGTHFRVWAPRSRRVDAVLEDAEGRPAGRVRLAREPGGYHSGWARGAGAGALYRFALSDGELLPDPASRFQPKGPEGPSQVVDPGAYRWRDRAWKGARLAGQVVYELHVGTFTHEGTWDAAARRLPALAALGVTAVEVMPVGEFPGRFGWGYDAVFWFAPTRLYGDPDDFRAFVDRAHQAGLAVLLDVVYNHLGPVGNVLPRFSNRYFAGRPTEWGPALNYDGPDGGPVRELLVSNAAHWIGEYRLDGLRFDATQSVFDGSPRHVLAEAGAAARAAARGRSILLVAENEPQEARIVRPAREGGWGFDAVWNDDFHHSARVALTGRADAYFQGYAGAPQELISALTSGYLYQGQRYAWQDKRRGTPTDGTPAAAFVAYLENHDQVANTLDGRRLHRRAAAGPLRAMTALLLLGPNTPMLFQGQEFASSRPFLYFADHGGAVGRAVREGRRKFLSQFRGIREPESARALADPRSPATFEACKLDHAERERNLDSVRLHRDLLALRRSDPVLSAQRGDLARGAVLGPAALVLRLRAESGEERLLVANLGAALPLAAPAEPLLAAPPGRDWTLVWSSERPEYGGDGAVSPVDGRGDWRLTGGATSLLRPS